MLKEAIEKIAAMAKPEILEVGGWTWASKQLVPVNDPNPAPIRLHTLTGFLDKINHGFKTKEINSDYFFIHVKDFDDVRVVSGVHGHGQRTEIAQAMPYGNDFRFGNYYDAEDFIVSLQSLFVMSEATKKILSLVGNMTEGATRQTDDDGVTQTVTVKKGIALKQAETIPNPVTLAPYRTFIEVIQPESQFVFRVRSNKDGEGLPKCALFEADGGKWRNSAIELIAEWIRANWTDGTPTLPIVA